MQISHVVDVLKGRRQHVKGWSFSYTEGGDAVPTLKIEKPNEKQKLFMKDRHKHIGYGGA